ncbi:MAG: hypothetical protein RSE94_11665 [Pseudomonas sp.]
MHNVSKGPFKVIGGELVGKGDAPIAAFMTGFVGSAKGIFTTSEENQKDNAKIGLDAFRTFRSTKSLPSELARSLADAQAEIAKLRGALGVLRTALEKISDAETTVFDEGEQQDLVVAMDDEEMALIARLALEAAL